MKVLAIQKIHAVSNLLVMKDDGRDGIMVLLVLVLVLVLVPTKGIVSRISGSRVIKERKMMP